MGRYLTLLILFTALVSVSFPRGVFASIPSKPGPSALLSLESSQPVFDVLYRYGQVVPASNGAYGPNVRSHGEWFLEYQRAGSIDILDGVLRPDKDPALVAEGLKMFHFGLAREAANGSFPSSAWPFHGTAMFLSEAGPALSILRKSDLATASSSEIDWQIHRMSAAAYYMVRSVGGPGKIDDRTKNHRFFEAAIALGSVASLTDDATLRRWSTLYAWKGIHMQRPNGVMPEDGGHDSGYQALGLINATRYLALVASGKLRTALMNAINQGERWELSRVRANGSINQSGDTRTRGCEERNPAGACKTVFYAPIFSALARWAAISDDERYAHASHLVWLKSGYGG